MRPSASFALAFALAVTALPLVAGCAAVMDEDECRGIAGCAATEDRLGYERPAGEIGGEPAIVLTHTPKGAYPNDPITKKLAVFTRAGLSLRDEVPPDFGSQTPYGTKPVTITDLDGPMTRYEFPTSGDVMDVKIERALVRISVNGRTTASYTCVAGPNHAVSCTP